LTFKFTRFHGYVVIKIKKERKEDEDEGKKTNKKSALARDGVKSPVIVWADIGSRLRCTRSSRPCDDRKAIVGDWWPRRHRNDIIN